MLFTSKVSELKGVRHTGAEMLRLSVDFCDDVACFDGYTLEQFFNMVKSLTYKKDPPGVEHLSRPAASLSKYATYRDCDDKAILIAAYLTRQAKLGKKFIPWRFVAVSKKPDRRLHHVVNEVLINGEPRIIDATYPHNSFYKKDAFTAFQPITDWVEYGETYNPRR